MLAMADHNACHRYAPQLESQRCYARRHGLPRHVADVKPYTTLHPVRPARGFRPITFRKLEVLEKWLDEPACEWLAFFDADIFIVDAVRRREFARGGHAVSLQQGSLGSHPRPWHFMHAS